MSFFSSIAPKKLFGGLLLAAGVSLQTAYFFSKVSQDEERAVSIPNKIPPPEEASRRAIFDKKAPTFDREIGFDEFLLGIRGWRRFLVNKAYGDVLEVAAGTGRNFKHYNKEAVTSLTVTDFSRSMLKIATGKKEFASPIPMRFLLRNAIDLHDFEEGNFDTVIDTFGICSFEKPVETLLELKRVLKEDGQLLLLEHGASDLGFLQRYVDRNALRHASRHGCYYNRDIGKIVEEAGFKIVEKERKCFGTIWMILAKKRHPPHVE